jgi:hypothetical protein
MAVEITSSPAGLEMGFSGRVTGEDCARLIGEIVALEERLPVSPDRLTDFSATTELAIDFTVIERVAQARISRPPRNPIRNAIVAPRPAHFGIARMFQTLNTCPEVEMRIFRDRPSAEAWLRTPRT